MQRCQYPGCENAALEGSDYCAAHLGFARPPSPGRRPPGRPARASKPSHAYSDVPIQPTIQTTMPDPVAALKRLNKAVTARTKPKRKRK